MTTTGFSVADYNLWPALAMMTIVGLMFVGGSAARRRIGQGRPAPAAGKILRRRSTRRRTELVLPVRLNRRVVDERTRARSRLSSCSTSGSSSAQRRSRSTPRAPAELSTFDAVSVSASMLANVGLAFGVGGPLGSFEPFSDFSTL